MEKTNPIETIFQKRKAVIAHIMNNINGINECDAEDAFMEAIQKLLQADTNKIKHPQAWLSKAAFRIACHAQKRKEREKERERAHLEKSLIISSKWLIKKNCDPIVKEIVKMRINGATWHLVAKTLRISKKTAQLKCRNFLEEI